MRATLEKRRPGEGCAAAARPNCDKSIEHRENAQVARELQVLIERDNFQKTRTRMPPTVANARRPAAKGG
jgi:hypothetical protein